MHAGLVACPLLHAATTIKLAKASRQVQVHTDQVAKQPFHLGRHKALIHKSCLLLHVSAAAALWIVALLMIESRDMVSFVYSGPHFFLRRAPWAPLINWSISSLGSCYECRCMSIVLHCPAWCHASLLLLIAASPRTTPLQLSLSCSLIRAGAMTTLQVSKELRAVCQEWQHDRSTERVTMQHLNQRSGPAEMTHGCVKQLNTFPSIACRLEQLHHDLRLQTPRAVSTREGAHVTLGESMHYTS